MAKARSQKKNNVKNKPIDFLLLITVILLLALGIIMVFSASAPSSFAKSGDSYAYVQKQAILGGVGVIAMFVISKIDYRKYKKYYKYAYIIAIVVIALVPLIGKEVNGAKRWIDLGFTTFQPSEITKLCLIIFYAAYLSNNKDKIKKLKNGFIIPFVYIAPVAFILLFFQEHFSATLIIVAVTSIMMLLAGSRLTYFMTIGLVGAIAVGGFVLTQGADFRMNRINSFLDPWKDPTGDSWQIIQSLYAIGSGGIFGVGLRSKQTKIFIHIRAT